MPRRLAPLTRLWAYRFLCVRDGEHCVECLIQPTNPISATSNEPISAATNSASTTVPAARNEHSRLRVITLEIDHINGKSDDDRPENLQLLCKSCNVKKENTRRSSSDLFVCVRKRRRKEGNSATRMVREAVEFSQGTAEMQANNFYEVRFRNWLLGTLAGTDHLEKEDVINSGAEVTGCSTATATRYLAKLTSSAGPLSEQPNLLGRMVIRLKPEIARRDGED